MRYQTYIWRQSINTLFLVHQLWLMWDTDYRHGFGNFQVGYWTHWLQNKWCTATLKKNVATLQVHYLLWKQHYLNGLSIWWQMLWRMKASTRWMLATSLWFLHQIWPRLRESIFSGPYLQLFKKFESNHKTLISFRWRIRWLLWYMQFKLWIS